MNLEDKNYLRHPKPCNWSLFAELILFPHPQSDPLLDGDRISRLLQAPEQSTICLSLCLPAVIDIDVRLDTQKQVQ